MPSVVGPFMKVTVPVGLTVPGTTTRTAAVKLTACPETDGLGWDVTVVVDESGRTCRSGWAPLAEFDRKSGSPL